MVIEDYNKLIYELNRYIGTKCLLIQENFDIALTYIGSEPYEKEVNERPMARFRYPNGKIILMNMKQALLLIKEDKD